MIALPRPQVRLFTFLVALFLAVYLGSQAQVRGETFEPKIAAKAAILIEPTSGDVLYVKNPDQRLPIASTTKLTTALVVLERAKLDDVFKVIKYKATPLESLGHLVPGETMRVSDLLQALLVASANDAGGTLAERSAGSQQAFVEAMNDYVTRLGLKNSHYVNPVGLDDKDHYSSAADLARIAQEVKKSPFLTKTVSLPKVSISSGKRNLSFENTNDLVGHYSFVNGMKTGHTNNAHFALVASAAKDGVEMISVVLDEPTQSQRDDDTLKLLRHGLASYKLYKTADKGQVVAQLPVAFRGQKVPLVAGDELKATLPRSSQMRTIVVSQVKLEGPLKAGSKVGTVEIQQDGRSVAAVPLLTTVAISAPSLLERAQAIPTFVPPVIFLGSLLVVLGVVRRRRSTNSEGKAHDHHRNSQRRNR